MFSSERMYTYVKGFAAGTKMPETLRALTYARDKHRDQLRKDGQPYIVHPLTMACHALALGFREDDVIAATLLHDVCEDCGVSPEELPIGDAIRHSVELLTFAVKEGETKQDALSRYYAAMLGDRPATVAKLIDRCHNVSSMAGPFSQEKLRDYIDETRRYVLPLLNEATQRWPEDSNTFFVLKYHILSVVDSIEAVMRSYGSET